MERGILLWKPQHRLIAFNVDAFSVPVKIGNRSRWAETEVDAWIASLKKGRVAA